MIKFFRTIRRKMLSQGKTIKYLQYAIGEIVLVVIGILIALSINNKSDEVADREAERSFYRNTADLLKDDMPVTYEVSELTMRNSSIVSVTLSI